MTALLVVDIQNGLVEKKLYNKQGFLDTVNNRIKMFKDSGNLVVYIQHVNNQLVENSISWEIAKEIQSSSNDIRIQKHHGNAFEKTELKKVLEERSVEEVVVCGLVTHGCVKATCIGALKEGYKVKLLKNGHSCWSSDAKEKIEVVEKELEELGVEVI